jgi:hypothetical protein
LHKSSRNECRGGNDTIHRYPFPNEGRLTKILCITEEVFKNLKVALAEFGLKPKLAQLEPKTSFRQKLIKKEPLLASRSDDYKPFGYKCTSSFEPTNSVYTRYRSGPFWTSCNLKAWFKEQASYEDYRYIKSYSVEF